MKLARNIWHRTKPSTDRQSYFDYLDQEFGRISSRDGALDLLKSIREGLESGELEFKPLSKNSGETGSLKYLIDISDDEHNTFATPSELLKQSRS